MVTGGQREAITDVIFSILTNTQTAAGAMIGAGADAYQKQQASGQTAGGIISQAKQKLLQNALVRYPRELVKETQKMSKSLLGRLGIQFSIASILKQSQIFTGVLGSVFQILGAMVDVFLAPLMPFFIRTLRGMVSFIPYVQEKGEQFAAWIEGVAAESTGILHFLELTLTGALKNILDEIKDVALEMGKNFVEKLGQNERFRHFAIDVGAGMVMGAMIPGVGSIAGGIAMGGANVLGLTRPHENRGIFANEEQEKKTNDIAYQENFKTYFGTEMSTQETWNQ